MSAKTHLWLIRHAPVDGPRGVIHGPDAPADTATRGVRGAAARLPRTRHPFCSPARRTRERRCRCRASLRPTPAFREQDFGAWTGRRHDELAANSARPIEEFWRSPASNRPPDGESFVDQIARVSDGLAGLPAGDVVLVVHSGTVRAALAIALDMTPESALRFVIDPLSLTRIDRLDSGWRVVAVNLRWKD